MFGNIKIYLNFLSFLNTETAQVVQILLTEKQVPFDHALVTQGAMALTNPNPNPNVYWQPYF